MELGTLIRFGVGLLNQSALCCSSLMDQDTTDIFRIITRLYWVNNLFPPSFPFPSSALAPFLLLWCSIRDQAKPRGQVTFLHFCRSPSQMEFFAGHFLATHPRAGQPQKKREERAAKTKPPQQERRERRTDQKRAEKKKKISFPPGWDSLRAGSRWLAPRSPLGFSAPPVSFCRPGVSPRRTSAGCQAPLPPRRAAAVSCGTRCPCCEPAASGPCPWTGAGGAGTRAPSWEGAQGCPESPGRPSPRSCWWEGRGSRRGAGSGCPVHRNTPWEHLEETRGGKNQWEFLVVFTLERSFPLLFNPSRGEGWIQPLKDPTKISKKSSVPHLCIWKLGVEIKASPESQTLPSLQINFLKDTKKKPDKLLK